MDLCYLFAYGPEVDENALAVRIQTIARYPTWQAYLPHYRFTFDLASYDSRSGLPAVVPDPLCLTYGVLYEVPEQRLKLLDEYPEVRGRYVRQRLDVMAPAGTVSAWVYLPEPALLSEGGKANKALLYTMVASGSLPEGYCLELLATFGLS